jgi:hypothetical protein
MNYSTDFKSIREQVSPEEWQAGLDLAACYRLVDVEGNIIWKPPTSVLEWPAMLRLLDADETRSGFPSYKH